MSKGGLSKQYLAATGVVAILLLLSGLTIRNPNPAIRNPKSSPSQRATPTPTVAPKTSNANRPAPTLDSAAAVELGHTIDRLIDESEFASARWGVYVMRLSDGRALYSRNADRLITPASNMKLYTTAVAL